MKKTNLFLVILLVVVWSNNVLASEYLDVYVQRDDKKGVGFSWEIREEKFKQDLPKTPFEKRFFILTTLNSIWAEFISEFAIPKSPYNGKIILNTQEYPFMNQVMHELHKELCGLAGIVPPRLICDVKKWASDCKKEGNDNLLSKEDAK